jgi:hypothetical protein
MPHGDVDVAAGTRRDRSDGRGRLPYRADRNIARVEPGVEPRAELDTFELASLSADAVPATVAALPTLDPTTRAVVEQDLSCLREELRDGVERFGWPSFNVARDIALERLNPLTLPSC